MGLTANTNISSIAAARAVYESRDDLTRAMERLSSGKRINSSRDDAAGQTVVSRMRAQITSLNQAIRNANDGLSMVQTYEGAADEIEDMLIRMRELATLVQNGTYNTADGANADLEYKQLKAEIDRIQSKTKFNGSLDIASAVGASAQTYSFQVGFNGGDAVSIAFGSLEASALAGGTVAHGFTNGFSAAAQASQITHAASAVTVADAMLSNLNLNRATAGAVINRLEHTISNLMNVVQRTEEARSRIEDADFAAESAAMARANVLVQAGSAMLAQANQSPQYILALLR
jgi:flagellin